MVYSWFTNADLVYQVGIGKTTMQRITLIVRVVYSYKSVYYKPLYIRPYKDLNSSSIFYGIYS